LIQANIFIIKSRYFNYIAFAFINYPKALRGFPHFPQASVNANAN
jgi:hypothetical protein